MKLVLFFTVLLAICSISFSALSRHPTPAPDKPGYCWSEGTGPMENGEEKTIENRCARASCNNDRTMTVATCGVSVLNGVRLTKMDLTKPYPQCCPGANRHLNL